MERDLDDVINESLAAREEQLHSALPEASGLAVTVARVRRRRRRRATGEVFAGVGVAAVLVVALTLGGHDAPPSPAVTQSPTPAPTSTTEPAPSPAPSPTTTPKAKPKPTMPSAADITAGLGLPAVMAPPDDIWDRVGEGWALGVYRPTWRLDDDHDSEPLRNTLVLASPDGRTYRVRELPLSKDVELVRWDPGATQALVTVGSVHDGVTQPGVRGWLDLRTGKVTAAPGAVGKPVDGWTPQTSFLGLDRRGDEVWFATYGLTGGGGPVTLVVQRTDGTLVHRVDLVGDVMYWGSSLLSPGGRLLAGPGHDDAEATFDVVDLESGKQTAHDYGVPGQYCQVVGWRTDDELLARCRAQPWSSTGFGAHLQSGGDPLYVVHLDGRAPRKVATLADGDPAVPLWQGRTLPGGDVVVGARPVGTDDDGSCAAGLYRLSDDAMSPLPVDHVVRATPVGTLGTRVYSLTETSCRVSDQHGQQLESLDDGTRTPLLRPPASRAKRLDGGLDTWAIAGGPAGHQWG